MVPLIGYLTFKRTGVVGWAVFCFFAMTKIIGINFSMLIKCKKQG